MRLAIVQEGRSPAARVISDLWALDFDDFGTQIAERLTSPGACQDTTEIEDADALEGGWHDG